MPCPRVGSIDSQSGFGPMPVAGQEVHNAFVNKRARQIGGYEQEVKLSHRFERGAYEIRVSGRVDGFIEGAENTAVIEEIKSDLDIWRLSSRLKDNLNHPYILQLLTYGYFYKEEKGREAALKLVLVSTKDGSTTVINVEADYASYQAWLDRRLDEVVEEYEALVARRNKRMELASKLEFPFPKTRKGQDRLVGDLLSSLKANKNCLVQAPTGLGKTAGVLYPALKSALAYGDQVIYVTAKNSQHEAVVEASRRLNRSLEKPLKTLVLTAKSKVCLKDEVYCNSDYCEYARDYYEKVEKGKLIEAMEKEEILDRDLFVACGKKNKVCPFELSLDCVDRADIVVGDYNYVFSPRNIMGRFQSGPVKERGHEPVLLVDEAHNLPDRAKSYYGASISEEQLLDLKSRIQKQLPNYSIAGQAIIEEFLKLMRGFSDNGRYGVKQIRLRSNLFESVRQKVSEFAQSYLKSSLVLMERDPILELNNLVSEFLDSLEREGEQFVVLSKPERGGTLKVVCLDAFDKLKDTYRKTRSTIAFSATLKPFDYFSDVLGFDSDQLDYLEFDSPFPQSNRKLLIVPQVSTKYSDRPKNYKKISEAIKRVTKMRPGNYVVFFPSFNFLEEVLSITRFDTRTASPSILVQERSMTVSGVQEILGKLRGSEQERNHVLFAVQGGIFAEGIDYPGSMLVGAIVVGPGLPKFDLETELLQAYFDKQYGEGYKYTFVYPAMAKVVQSAGRVIRSESDRGLIMLLGRRFLTPAFMEAMPDFWLGSGKSSLVSRSILKDLEEFWQGDRESVRL